MSSGRDNVVPIRAADGLADRSAPSAQPEPLTDSCVTCALRELCLPGGISVAELEQLDEFVTTRRRVRRGAGLYHAGDEFKALFAVRSGTFKTRVNHPDGRTQVLGFQLPGELLGLDGVAYERYGVDAIALEDSDVCVLPFTELERIARDFAPLQQRLHQVMSREIVREQGVMMMLGGLSAEQRVATLIAGLSERYRRLGYSSVAYVLRMTREDIGNFLGIKIETVSRALTRLDEQGVLRIDGKQVEIIDADALRERVGNSACSGCGAGA